MLRSITALFFLAATAFCAFVFEAASTAERVAVLGREALKAPSSSTRDVLLARATALPRASWAVPLAWHAPTADALAYVSLLGAEASTDPETRLAAFNQANDASERAVALTPTMAVSWHRLAMLAQQGAPSAVCAPIECLEASWRAAPMTRDFQFACDRIRLGRAAGMELGPSDWRVQYFAASRYGMKRTSSCLTHLPAIDLFRVLINGQMRGDDAYRRFHPDR
jgi:hypothetical protein